MPGMIKIKVKKQANRGLFFCIASVSLNILSHDRIVGGEIKVAGVYFLFKKRSSYCLSVNRNKL